MHDYDVTLKRIVNRPGSALLAELTGCDRLRWLNVETPRVRNLRMDCLGELPDGSLVHLEFHSWNDRNLPLSVAEYLFAAIRTHGRAPRQIVIYVGKAKMRMPDRIEGPDYSVRFHLVDIRDLDGEKLLASPNLGDNVIAVLTRLGSEPGALRRILKRIEQAPLEERGEALMELSILADLRMLAGEVKREVKNMPLLKQLMKNEIFGPSIRKGLRQGLKEGIKQGRAEGLVDGRRELLQEMLAGRFGVIPPKIRKRLAALSPAETAEASMRLLDARRIEDVFPPSPTS